MLGTADISLLLEMSVLGLTLAFTSAPSFVPTFTLPLLMSSDLKTTSIKFFGISLLSLPFFGSFSVGKYGMMSSFVYLFVYFALYVCFDTVDVASFGTFGSQSSNTKVSLGPLAPNATGEKPLIIPCNFLLL